MDSFENLIKRMVKALNDAGLDYVFMGARQGDSTVSILEELATEN
jgi:hypothetical protein